MIAYSHYYGHIVMLGARRVNKGHNCAGARCGAMFGCLSLVPNCYFDLMCMLLGFLILLIFVNLLPYLFILIPSFFYLSFVPLCFWLTGSCGNCSSCWLLWSNFSSPPPPSSFYSSHDYYYYHYDYYYYYYCYCIYYLSLMMVLYILYYGIKFTLVETHGLFWMQLTWASSKLGDNVSGLLSRPMWVG